MKVCVIPGDGIGREVMEACLKVLESLQLDLDFIHAEAGLECFKRKGSFLPEETIEAVKDSDSCLLGAVASPRKLEEYESPLIALRRELELFANVRPFRCLHGGCLRDLDIIMIRENTEGMYSGIERVEEDKVITERVVSKGACERIVKFAFEYALENGRQKVSCLHKVNVLKSDRLFRKVFYDVGESYDLEKDDCYVDAAALHLIKAPELFDTIVTLNLYGDILSDEIAGLVGGLGFAPSGNIGERYSIFEPVHGSAPDIAGKGIANPTAMILSSAMMLSHLGYGEGDLIVKAIEKAYSNGAHTIDVGGRFSTQKFTDEVIKRLKDEG
jgi:isopropylmalate/isohomocitrate dehydrogenase-like protein